MKTNMPYFKFFPGDWARDPNLRSCSLGARGLWIEMLSIMHFSEIYGHFLINYKVPDIETSCRLIGCKKKEFLKFLKELESAGVLSRDENNIIFSRRMIKDENRRITNKNNGLKSINSSSELNISPHPPLPPQVYLKVNPDTNKNSSPSYSCSSSYSDSSSNSHSSSEENMVNKGVKEDLPTVGGEKKLQEEIIDLSALESISVLPLRQCTTQHKIVAQQENLPPRIEKKKDIQELFDQYQKISDFSIGENNGIAKG